MTSPFIPSSFTYGDAPQGGNVMPMIIAGRNPSDTIDTQYDSGYFWLSALNLSVNGVPGSGNLYIQAGNQAGLPNWVALSAGAAGGVASLSDGANTVLPGAGGNIRLLGTLGQIVVTGDAATHSLTFSLSASITFPGAVTVNGLLTAADGLSVSAGNVDIASGNLTLDAGNLSVTGTTDLEGSTTINTGTGDTTDIGTGGSGAVNIGNTTGGVTITGLTTLGALTVLGNVSINASGAGTTTIGGSGASGAIIIDAGTSASGLQILGNANTIGILIGNDDVANVLVFGNKTSTTNMQLLVGTGGSPDLLIDGVTTTKMQMGTSITTGLITIGGTAQTGAITVGQASGGVVDIALAASIAATTTVNVLTGATPAAATIMNIMTAAQSGGASQFNLFTGNITGGSQTFNLATGTGAAAINIGTGTTGVKTIAIGGTAANVITLGSTQTAGSVTVGALMTTGTITIGSLVQTGTVNIAPSAAALIVDLMNGICTTAVSQTLNIASGAATNGTQNVNIFESTASSTAQNLNIFNAVNTVGTNTINVSTTTGAPVALNLLTGVPASGTHTIIIGSATGVGTLVSTAATSQTFAIGANNNIILSSTGGNYKGKAAITAPSAGFIGEQIRATVASGSAVSLTTATPANITSISLTAGIWNVSGIISFTGTPTVTGAQLASINTTSATIGTQGDNAISAGWVTASFVLGDCSLSIPSFRISLGSTTTVYLVAQGTFSASTLAGYGRISATRVA